MIKAEIYNQNIKLNCESVASDSVKYLKIKFFPNESWEGTVKTAVFKNEEQNISVSVILEDGNDLYLGDNTCYVPFEVIKPPCFSVSLNGSKEDTLITTLPEKIRVYQSGDITADEAESYTPSQYEQLVSIYNEAKNIAQSVRDDADNGVFDGEKGKDAITDLKYNPKSDNAQSGKAVAEALKLKKCVCITGEGAPSAFLSSFDEDFEVGSLYMDTITNDIWKCVERDEDFIFWQQETIKPENKYNPKSYLPQSGVAVAVALNGLIEPNVSGEYIAIKDASPKQPNFSLKATSDTITDFSDVTVKRYGKNLLNVALAPIHHTNSSNAFNYERTNTGIKLTFNREITNTNSYKLGFILGETEDFRGKDITISLNYKTTVSGAYNTIYVYAYDKTYTESNGKVHDLTKDGVYVGDSAIPKETVANTKADGPKDKLTFRINDTITKPYIALHFHMALNGSSEIGNISELSNIQVELGDTVTEYEPYIEPQTVNVNSDGTVEGIAPISPSMTFVTNNNDAVLECEYTADLKKYIDTKFLQAKG